MFNLSKVLYVFASFVFITSCGLSILNGGTHGKVQGYIYNVPKNKVDSVIQILVKNNNKVIKEEEEGESIYFTIIINDLNKYHYVYRYYGDENYLNEHPNESKFFITAIKKNNEEFKKGYELNSKEKKDAIILFERYFILKLDSILGKTALKFE